MASTAVSSLHSALDRLHELAALPTDWDSYGAVPPSSLAIAGARHMLSDLLESLARSDFHVEPWAMGARADGGVMVEWRGPGGALEVHVEPDGTFGYLFEDTRSGRQTEADGVLLADIKAVIERSAP